MATFQRWKKNHDDLNGGGGVYVGNHKEKKKPWPWPL
jgi:hypothetical protein